jgi:hypothetical protein
LTYKEFKGGHEIPPDVATDAVGWFTGRQLEAANETSLIVSNALH